jgi:hypothetical protein
MTPTANDDHRSVMGLLMGRIRVRQLIDREIEEVRKIISAGENKEYLALLPGLEIERHRIADEIVHMEYRINGTVPIQPSEQLALPPAPRSVASSVREIIMYELAVNNGKLNLADLTAKYPHKGRSAWSVALSYMKTELGYKFRHDDGIGMYTMLKQGRTHKNQPTSSGWPSDPEERRAEMARRVAARGKHHEAR